jgi:hypothetical protein
MLGYIWKSRTDVACVGKLLDGSGTRQRGITNGKPKDEIWWSQTWEFYWEGRHIFDENLDSCNRRSAVIYVIGGSPETTTGYLA